MRLVPLVAILLAAPVLAQPQTVLYPGQTGAPLLSAIVLALSGWSGQPFAGSDLLDVGLRMLIWTGGSVSTLLFLFDQIRLQYK